MALAGAEARSSLKRSSTPRRGRTLNLAMPSLAPLESASTRRGLLPHTMTTLKFGARFLSITRFHRSGGAGLHSRRRSRPLRDVPLRGTGGIRASSPAGETGMSEPVGADLPVARDDAGQLSMDALRSPAPGDAPGEIQTLGWLNQPLGWCCVCSSFMRSRATWVYI